MTFIKFEEYFEVNNSLISDVVTYHLRLEALLEIMLKELTPNPNFRRIERMTFSQKAKAVFDENLIDEPLYEVVRKLNLLRNNFAHQLNYSPDFEDVHAIVVKAGNAGVDFSDGIDVDDLEYVCSLNYDAYMLMNALFRNVFFEIACMQEDSFWQDILS